MARTKRWDADSVKDGIGEVRLASWRYFMDFVYQRMLDYETYIWRGHRCDNWKLESTLDRLVGKVGTAVARGARLQHLERFKYATRGRRGPNPSKLETENDWWALGQHNGLATPLLDWTTSPFVAAYFAFIGPDDPAQTKYRAVYALHRPTVQDKVEELLEAERTAFEDRRVKLEDEGKTKTIAHLLAGRQPRPEVEFVRPLSDENHRLVNQGGLFTRAPDRQTLEAWVAKAFAGKDKGYTLMKILIPNKDRALCLRMLNRMNINHLSLFPDLYGASAHCNLHIQIHKY